MADEFLKEVEFIANQLYEEYKSQRERFQKIHANAVEMMTDFEKIRDNTKNDPTMRWTASNLAVSESLTMMVYSSYMGTLNALARLSITIYQSLTEIANELSQMKQQRVPSASDVEKITVLEERLTSLNSEFKKYSPTLRKFKQALDQTEKILRDNK
jgi:DNA repair ATPase RecN